LYPSFLISLFGNFGQLRSLQTLRVSNLKFFLECCSFLPKLSALYLNNVITKDGRLSRIRRRQRKNRGARDITVPPYTFGNENTKVVLNECKNVLGTMIPHDHVNVTNNNSKDRVTDGSDFCFDAPESPPDYSLVKKTKWSKTNKEGTTAETSKAPLESVSTSEENKRKRSSKTTTSEKKRKS
jgi:hypothetical protein